MEKPIQRWIGTREVRAFEVLSIEFDPNGDVRLTHADGSYLFSSEPFQLFPKKVPLGRCYFVDYGDYTDFVSAASFEGNYTRKQD